ncbi:MAG TPA: hypothetical protein VG125_28585 [Pirellulales bacterium]|jgi:hypothetical protein|nr:hypothetical protein [Pirellulales bacterium]
MSADFWLAVELLGFVLAASLLVWGVWKVDVRPLAAGAALAGLVWLTLACTGTAEWISYELVSLRLRPVDAESHELIADAVVETVEPSDGERSTASRLPATVEVRSDGGTFLAVSLMVELQVKGSLVEQYYEPGAHSRVADQELQILAPGYRPWRGTLTQLLPDGWPTTPAEAPIVVELEPLPL